MEYLNGEGPGEGDDEVNGAYSHRGLKAYSLRQDHTAMEIIGTTRKRGTLTELQHGRIKTRRYGVEGVEGNAFYPLRIDSSRVAHAYDDEDEMTIWSDRVENGVELESIKSPRLDPDPHEGRAYRVDISVSSTLGASPSLAQHQGRPFAPPRPPVSSSPRTHADIYLPSLTGPPPHNWVPSYPSPHTTSAPISPVELQPMHQRLAPSSPSFSYSRSYQLVQDSLVLSNPSHQHPERFPNLPSPPPLPSRLATASHTHNHHHPHTFARHDYRYLPTPPSHFFTSPPVPSTSRSREEEEDDDRD
ncbi:hypothetical protein DL93DRAFT_2174692, partial [Clavulina sp. PMI_390]